MPDWIARPAEARDTAGLLALQRAVFGREPDPSLRQWKFSRLGPAPGVWVVQHQGQLIFHYAGIPVRTRVAGQLGWAMVSVDTMTHPNFRRRGLLTDVGAQVYAAWAQMGIGSVLGLPNDQWGSRAQKLGWTRVGELRWWVRWLSPLKLLAERLGVAVTASSAGFDPWETTGSGWKVGPNASKAELAELADQPQAEGVVHDPAWIEWRYPTAVPPWEILGARRGGRLRAWAALRSAGPTGYVGEIRSNEPRAARVVLGAAIERLRKLGSSRAAMLIAPGGPLEGVALSLGFLPRRATFEVQAVDLGGGLPRGAVFQGADFDVV